MGLQYQAAGTLYVQSLVGTAAKSHFRCAEFLRWIQDDGRFIGEEGLTKVGKLDDWSREGEVLLLKASGFYEIRRDVGWQLIAR